MGVVAVMMKTFTGTLASKSPDIVEQRRTGVAHFLARKATNDYWSILEIQIHSRIQLLHIFLCEKVIFEAKMGQIQYSEKYFDDIYEYRHVVLPAEVAKLLPKNRLLSENEWRAIGVQQSRGWVHYAIHRPEPHIMLFRRPLNYQQQQENQA
ncbi:hypothetical protein BUALT_Bualt13G0067800 [Buddleja alternifolia]|uniref:Cyclin-dependent kinases regulatory subunit n=1 Tax=Buddleja alternifolia TaxID=168488 RepID=A0AAV6WS28_9LAMI|nr:hypothetical protein BUALT_Bualt13G0067800 [Buddleja alternifolia]